MFFIQRASEARRYVTNASVKISCHWENLEASPWNKIHSPADHPLFGILSVGHLYFTVACPSVCVTCPSGIPWHLKADEVRDLEAVLHYQTVGYILNLVGNKAVISTWKTTATPGILRKQILKSYVLWHLQLSLPFSFKYYTEKSTLIFSSPTVLGEYLIWLSQSPGEAKVAFGTIFHRPLLKLEYVKVTWKLNRWNYWEGL